MEKTMKQELLELGMKENEIDNHASDLYVLKNDISTQWLNNYKFPTMVSRVTTFISNEDKRTWYEIPFGFMNEYMESKKR